MKSLIAKLLLPIVALGLATAPLDAQAATFAVQYSSPGVRAGVGWHGGPRPQPYGYGYGYEHRGYGYGYEHGPYGYGPAGYPYHWNGRWYHHRRWHNGVWIYI